jgi:hypothetical protein
MLDAVERGRHGSPRQAGGLANLAYGNRPTLGDDVQTFEIGAV